MQARPVSNYGESKLEGEIELLRFAHQFPISIVRPPPVYGPRDQGVFIFIKMVSEGLMPVIHGQTPDKNKFMSIVHVDDLCQGIIKAGLVTKEQCPSGEVFYICSDEVVSLAEILETVQQHLGNRVIRLPVPRSLLRLSAVVADQITKTTGRPLSLSSDKVNELLQDYWICSNQKAKEKLGFEPQVSLDQGMKETIEWYKDHGWIR